MSLKEAKLSSLSDKLYGPATQGEGSKKKEKKVEKKKLFKSKKK